MWQHSVYCVNNGLKIRSRKSKNAKIGCITDDKIIRQYRKQQQNYMSKLNPGQCIHSPKIPSLKLPHHSKSNKRQTKISPHITNSYPKPNGQGKHLEITPFQLRQSNDSFRDLEDCLCACCEEFVAEFVCYTCGCAYYCKNCLQKIHRSHKFCLHYNVQLNLPKQNINNELCINSATINKQLSYPTTIDKQKQIEEKDKDKTKQKQSQKQNNQTQPSLQIKQSRQQINKILGQTTIQKKYDKIREFLVAEFEGIKNVVEMLELNMMKELQGLKNQQLQDLRKECVDRIDQQGNGCDVWAQLVGCGLREKFDSIKDMLGRFCISRTIMHRKASIQNRLVKNRQEHIQIKQPKSGQIQKMLKPLDNKYLGKKWDTTLRRVLSSNLTSKKSIEQGNRKWKKEKQVQIKKVKSETTLPCESMEMDQNGEKYPRKNKNTNTNTNTNTNMNANMNMNMNRNKVGIGCTLSVLHCFS